jgi:hypothetical protein
VERAETIPSLALLKKLAAALGTRVEIRLVPRDQALGGVTGRGIEQAT